MSINTEGGVDILTKEDYINCNITLFDTETGKSFANEIADRTVLLLTKTPAEGALWAAINE